jgi:hypothetical protein
MAGSVQNMGVALAFGKHLVIERLRLLWLWVRSLTGALKLELKDVELHN